MDERSARLAENEAVFRAANAAINDNLADGTDNEVPYVCECGTDTCFERVALTRREFQAVRSHPARFFVVPGHEDETAGEVVVERASRYTVVEKGGVERKVVERAEPDFLRRP